MKAYLTLRSAGKYEDCPAGTPRAIKKYTYVANPDGSRNGQSPVQSWHVWMPNGKYVPEYHGQVIHLYNAPGKAKGRAGKFGRVAEVDLSAQIPMDATPQEKLEHYEAMMLKYGALMDALRQEILDGR